MKWKVELAALSLLLAACGGQMSDQPKLEPYEGSRFFADGRASRPLPEGTIARGRLRDSSPLFTGKSNGEPARGFPVAVTPEMIQAGRDRYDVVCAVCHDRTGGGTGMIVRRGYTRPPSFHEERLRQAPEGYFFDVITHGFGRMPSMAYQTTPQERWSIVAYIRALQLSRNVRLADLTEDERNKLTHNENP